MVTAAPVAFRSGERTVPRLPGARVYVRLVAVVSLDPVLPQVVTEMLGGDAKFVCVDGPEFDAHQVDFKQLADRLAMYRDVERDAYKGNRCMIEGLAEAAGDSPR